MTVAPIAVILLSLASIPRSAASGQQPAAAAQRPGRCVTFETPARLHADASFTRPIGNRLEFRLGAQPGGIWTITVGPQGTREDYLWVVSPPLQTAPHLLIGAGYNLTATESARLTPRRFRFVTTAQEYDDAVRLVEAATGVAGRHLAARDLEKMGKGSLELWITGFGSAQARDELAWIRVRGRACQPR